MLVIGAHPDDENTDLLALLAQKYGADVAYLSLSRGDGGQNLVGDELGEGLGLLRTRELQAARSIDGAHQFFTRAFDFGFTRSLPETKTFWPPDEVLKDVVRVIRRFRPQVLVSIFTGTPRDGHGQHQMAGVMAQQAWDAAGDPSRYPELETEEGLDPWTPLKFYRSVWGNAADATLTLSTGGIDPRTGKTYHQIAMLSRSQHRSQNMGQLQPMGPSVTHVQLIATRTGAGADSDIFDGVPGDTTWLAGFVDSLRHALPTGEPTGAVAALAAASKRAVADGFPDSTVVLLHRALAVAAGVELDAIASEDDVVPGDTVGVDLEVYDGGPMPVTVQSADAGGPKVSAVHAQSVGAVAAGAEWRASIRVPVAPTTPLSQPYFLQKPRNGDMYDWSDAPPAVRGLPFGPPFLTAHVSVDIAGVPVTLNREVSYRIDDQVQGELRRPLDVVPAVDVKLTPDHLVWSATGPTTHTFTVTLAYNGHDSVSGTVGLEAGDWRTPAPKPIHFAHHGADQTVTLTLTKPASVKAAEVTVRAVARLADGERFDRGVTVIDYPHVRPTYWVQDATSDVRVAPIALPKVASVGYVRGAADRVPEALLQIGVPVHLLDADALAHGDLSRYDVIVIGSRAYETDSALMRYNDRLLRYVQNGGRMLVQYQQYQYVDGHYAPYPLTIARPHDRVTDETAPVDVLRPNDPAFTTPNDIGPSDWKGWPQERGLYFAHSWDEHYVPLLEMHDSGMPPLDGGLLVARYGKGTYIYTGISFFRALPADVPGAFRLFLNLLGPRGTRATE